MSHNQLDRMLEYHAVFCHTLQYFVTLVSTLSHCAVLCHTVQYFVTLCNTSAIVCHPTHSPCHREQGGSENRRKPSLWTLGKRQPCDLQEVCGLHLERKGKVSGSAAILLRYLCNTFVILLCIQRKRSALFWCECKQWCAPHWLAAVWGLSAVQTCRLTTFGGNREPEDRMQILLCEIYTVV